MDISSIFIVGAFGGFDFNEDERFAPARCFKGGSNAYLQVADERYDVPNQYACVVDVPACLNIIEKLSGELSFIEAINHVHIHELCHACDECKSTQEYEKEGFTHTHHWNQVLLELSRLETSCSRTIEKQTKRIQGGRARDPSIISKSKRIER